MTDPWHNYPTVEILTLSRQDGWYAGDALFSNSLRPLQFFVPPSGSDVRFYRTAQDGQAMGGGNSQPMRLVLLHALGFPVIPPRRAKAVQSIDVPSYRPPTRRMDDIVAELAALYGLTTDAIRAKGRQSVEVKHEAMWLMAEAGHSLPAIGRYMGGRHHTSVMYGRDRHAARLAASSMQVAA